MKLSNFFGGSDVQRSTNLSDNKCINLYPTTDNSGNVVALTATPGLSVYVNIPGGLIASVIYTASNGRCFLLALTSLYELTVGGVLTLRGTLTAGVVTNMSDNGNEMIIVNGIDGWLFTFASNALRQIKVISVVCTISIANPCVITKITHGLIAGDRVRFSTTGSLPTGLLTSTTYYVLAAGLTADAFEVALTDVGAAIITTGSQSGTHTMTTIGYGFPNGAQLVSYMNGRFIACQPNTQNFFVSEVLNGGWWDQLNVQTADSNPDFITGQVVSHNELIVFCELSGEVFYDSGTVPSPFVRNVSGVFEVGCKAPYSIARIDNSVMWLGNSSTGKGIVYRLNGFTPTRISTYSIEYAIQSMSLITDAIAFAYQQDGHHFYVLTFPTGGRTFVFDINTNMWHERAELAGGVLTQWQVKQYAFFDNKHLVCDIDRGRIYSLDLNVFTDGLASKKWIRSWRTPDTDMKRVAHHKLTLDIESGVGVGVDQQIMMRFSDDGGHTWSNELWRDIGASGQYRKRVFWHRLGITSGRPRVYELSGTSPVKTILLGAYLE